MTELVHTHSEGTLASLKARFDSLVLRALKIVDPLSYDLCDRLLVKAAEDIESGRSSRAKTFINRLDSCLTRLEKNYEAYAEVAQKQVDLIKQQYRSEFSRAASLKQNYHYLELNKLYQNLTKQTDDAKVFTDLKAYLEKHEWSQASQQVIGLDALLYDLNDGDDSNFENSQAGLKPLKAASDDSEQLEELKSLQNYREYLGRVVTENMVRQVIKEDPENAGPLNPQRLLVRTLSTMKDLSPSYVNRLVPYFDSLMTLDEMSNA